MDYGTALLGSDGDLTSFTYGPTTIRFRTSPKLKRWLSVKEWDDGYIVVDGDFAGQDGPIEDYIDLKPILERLYIDPEGFLAPIKEVHVDERATR